MGNTFLKYNKSEELVGVLMAWRFNRVEEQREALIEAYIAGCHSMTELCNQFGVSRKTAYKWYKRYISFGKEGLLDRSRTPHHPYICYSEFIIDLAIELKRKHLSWGPKKIIFRLMQLYPNIDWPSATRLYEIFKLQNLVTVRRIRRKVPATHPLAELNQSNDVWVADFKGWFLTKDKSKCEPLTITDAFSRYLIKCTHLTNKSSDYVWPIFKEAFEEYGLPLRIRTDNGPPFGSTGVGRLTKLSLNLIKSGVTPEWINPGHPEENGRHERFHLTLQQSVTRSVAETLKDQIKQMSEFHREYNFERPHEALGMQTPGSVYKHSLRKWDGILRSPDYDTQIMLVRKVGDNGCIWIKHEPYYIGETLKGEHVGLKESGEDFAVYYGSIYLGKLGKNQRIEKPILKRKNIVRRG